MKEFSKIDIPIDGENVFTIILLVIAVFMFQGASNYSSDASTFPRVIAGAATIGCLLLLFSKYLPKTLRKAVEEEANIVDRIDDEELPEGDNQATDNQPSDENTEPRNSAYLGALVVGYATVAYFLSFLAATPAFLIAYVYVFDINRYYGAALIIIGVAIIIGFETALGVPLYEGALIEFEVI